MWILGIIIAVSGCTLAERQKNNICRENYNCVPIGQCRTDSSIDIIYPCNEERTHVCCLRDNFIGTNVVSRTSAFPDVCGIVSSADRITGGDTASIGQFPWMALLGYRQRGVDFIQFLCGGSIITPEYVLTAAHCITIDPRLTLYLARFGELDLMNDTDCENTGIGDGQICADPYVDVVVTRTIPHDRFDSTSLENDIAVVKLKRKLTFTDYIQPICLPFQSDIKYQIDVRKKLSVSGWGKTDSGNIGGSTTLQYTQVTVWEQARCNISVPPRVRPIRKSQICANGLRKQDACKGDSGGPLTNTTLINGDVRNYQVGIVSFSSAQVCGNAELPTIYTRVDNYLDWIVSKVV